LSLELFEPPLKASYLAFFGSWLRIRSRKPLLPGYSKLPLERFRGKKVPFFFPKGWLGILFPNPLGLGPLGRLGFPLRRGWKGLKVG